MQKRLCLALIVILVVAACTKDGAPEAGAGVVELPLRPLTIAEVEQQKRGSVGPEKAIPAQELVFSDQETWVAFWGRHEVASAPRIDFSLEEVAAVFLGSSGYGYDVRITNVLYDLASHRKKVVITESLPDPNKTVPAIGVYPADIVAFPRRTGDIVFERVRVIRSD